MVSLYWSIFLFNLRVQQCYNNINLLPFSNQERKEICIQRVIKQERSRK